MQQHGWTVLLSEVSQTGKDKYHMRSTYMWNLNYGTNELICETNRFADIKHRLIVTQGEGWVGGFGISRCKLLYIEQINTKVLL